MPKLDDVMAYFCTHYPHKDELSKARLTKMVFLADWKMVLTAKKQITPLVWTFNHYGPYLEEVKTTALAHPDRFTVSNTTNMYGYPKEVIGLVREESVSDSLSRTEIDALDHVIDQTKDLTWAPFIKLVYSTYPIATQPRHTNLDLVGLGKKYERELAAIS